MPSHHALADSGNVEFLCETIKRTAFKITRMGELVGREAARRLGTTFGIVDISLAPTPAIGDSVSDILELIGVERTGAPGTTAALALLTMDAAALLREHLAETVPAAAQVTAPDQLNTKAMKFTSCR